MSFGGWRVLAHIRFALAQYVRKDRRSWTAGQQDWRKGAYDTGYFELNKQSPYWRRITTALRRRGLVPGTDEEWIIHGPHGPDLPQPVFIGWARKRAPGATVMDRRPLMLVVTPRGVFEIEEGDESRWGEVTTERRILTLASRRRQRLGPRGRRSG